MSHQETRGMVLTGEQIVCGYQGRPIFAVPYLHAEPGEIISIIGASGSGKTTLLRSLAGNLPFLAGTCCIEGISSTSNGYPARTAQTLQSFPLFHWLTVRENLKLAAKIKKIKNCNYDDILQSFSALKISERFPDSLSGGEQCRASLSQALIGNPRLLLLDEPFNGLDIVVKDRIAQKILEWVETNKSAAIFVTHDLFDAVKYSSRILVTATGSPGYIADEISADNEDAYKMARDALVASQ